jgi:hypothetical protein
MAVGLLKRMFGGGTPPPAATRPVPGNGQPGDVGIFAGLFVATPEAVELWSIEQGVTPPDWPAIEFKRLETVKMGTLESILTGVPYDDIDQDDLHDLVREGGSDGPWISRLRQPLVDALSTLEDSRIPVVAAAWADTDEFKVRPSDKASPAVIEGLSGGLAEMRELVQVGSERGEPMFLMMGL